MLYHVNALWALRRITEVWGGEVEPVITVADRAQGPAGTTPDLSEYATKQHVDDAIAALANLEEEEF